MGGGGVPGGIGGGVSVGVGGGGSPPGGGALLDSSPRTLWLSGFPLDVKHREIHNFFRPYRGYEDSILKPNGIAFVTFTSHEAALTAKNDITVRSYFYDNLFVCMGGVLLSIILKNVVFLEPMEIIKSS